MISTISLTILSKHCAFNSGITQLHHALLLVAGSFCKNFSGTVSGRAIKRTVETYPFNDHSSASPVFMLSPPNPEDLFLNPGSTRGSAETALLIPEFVMKVTADQDESIFNIGNNAKLSASYGNRRLNVLTVNRPGFSESGKAGGGGSDSAPPPV